MGRPQCTDILSYLRIFSLFATVFSTGTSLVVNILQMICWPVFLSVYFEHLLESGIGKKKEKENGFGFPLYQTLTTWFLP